MCPREKGVRVGAEAEERDVPEVEQPREADNDIETEREEGIDEDEEAVVVEVRLAQRQERHKDRRREQRQLACRRQHPPEPLDAPTEPAPLAALVGRASCRE